MSYLRIPRPLGVMENMLVSLFAFYLSIQMQSVLNLNFTKSTIIVIVVFVLKCNWCNKKSGKTCKKKKKLKQSTDYVK